MSESTQPPLLFRRVLQHEGRPPKIYSVKTEGVDKPDGGFRLPNVYFSWAVLGESRTLHHHQDHDELVVVLEGRAKVYLYGDGKPGQRFEAVWEVASGDVVVFPQGWDHSIQEIGLRGTFKALLVFNNQDLRANEILNGFELPKGLEGYCLGENS